MTKFVEKFYSLEEDELQVLIINAKNGNREDQIILLDVFSNFLKKYHTLLYEAKFNLEDTGIKKFISLFVGDPYLNMHLRRGTLSPIGKKSVYKTMRDITFMVRRYCDEEDVRNTIEMTFLECVDRYERRGEIPFSGFLFNYFFYMLKKNVKKYMIYQHGRKTFPLITSEGNNPDGDEKSIGFKEPVDYKGSDDEQKYMTDNLDHMWVLGDTAIEPFNLLSTEERQLLKWRYVDNLKTSQIAEITTEHPNTVREHLYKIRIKLKKLILEGDYDIIIPGLIES